MTRQTSEVQPPTVSPTVHDHFGRFAASASAWLGSTWAFVAAGLVIAAWAATGPIFHFSNHWAQVISTATALATFLMVFLIQSTQNRDSRAINLKLNELIRAADNARNQMIDIERLTDLELDAMQATYEQLKRPGPSARRGVRATLKRSAAEQNSDHSADGLCSVRNRPLPQPRE